MCYICHKICTHFLILLDVHIYHRSVNFNNIIIITFTPLFKIFKKQLHIVPGTTLYSNCNVHYTVYSVQCTVCIVRCTVCTVQCIVYNLQCILYGVHCTVYGVKCTLHGVYCALQCILYMYGIQYTVYIVHYSQYGLFLINLICNQN